MQPFQLIAAPFTPMNSDRSLCLERIPDYYALLKEQSVNGAFVCGTTGEGVALTTEERKRVAEAWAQARASDTGFKLFIHVGAECQPTSCDLAAHAASTGMDAIAMTSSTFLKPSHEAQAVEQAREVAASAPQTPFYYYHIPSMTGLNYSIVRIITLAREQIPSFAGVKFTHYDAGEFLDCLVAGEGNVDLLYGRDELLIAGLAAGATGAVGSTYNFAAPLYRKLIDAFTRGDMEEARRYQYVARQMINTLIQYGGLPAMKSMMKLSGVDCGPCRMPFDGLSEEGYKAFGKALEACRKA